MSVRLWYPQLDVYDALRRMSVLIGSWGDDKLGIERLYISDFFFASPTMLHNVHMRQDARKRFNTLKIPRPDKSFLSYPSAPLLFQKMSSVQTQAIQTLIGKELVNVSRLEIGYLQPSERGHALFRDMTEHFLGEKEERLRVFLSQEFTEKAFGEISELRRQTGLRRHVQ